MPGHAKRVFPSFSYVLAKHPAVTFALRKVAFCCGKCRAGGAWCASFAPKPGREPEGKRIFCNKATKTVSLKMPEPAFSRIFRITDFCGMAGLPVLKDTIFSRPALASRKRQKFRLALAFQWSCPNPETHSGGRANHRSRLPLVGGRFFAGARNNRIHYSLTADLPVFLFGGGIRHNPPESLARTATQTIRI